MYVKDGLNLKLSIFLVNLNVIVVNVNVGLCPQQLVRLSGLLPRLRGRVLVALIVEEKTIA